MAKNQEEKTNVMRLLSQKKIEYKSYSYEPDATMTGTQIAGILGEDPKKVFKTLVTDSKSGEHYVFVIPVERELDLKKAAKAVSEKSISMLPQKELLPLTGYVHGGCSPIGMKKTFATVIHEEVNGFDSIFFSAGKVGFQVEVPVKELSKVIRFTTADVCE
ncbi:Cys-tRNA(Pro) deacylase [Butyrivibrio sp. CB08]|uniref:Cys-tRNA(Pro) deacylase n=1 Tax=Butyrivibrio sp. CB08 TaxID=2364879 RepID=UPI000EA9D884|nr:Cys-tRNA(Pro) deacylase [Butyrivibrio sp. CB08]RKM61178.1 Cys-tRNA(Pro) deacylase [Butyrivibrio sp. CB08]